MALPLWEPLRDTVRAVCSDAGARVATAIATIGLSIVAIGFFVSAGFAALMPLIGFPATALTFGALFTLLALVAHLWGRKVSARRIAKVTAARTRVNADIALAATLARSAQPLLPLAAFVTAFVLARRG